MYEDWSVRERILETLKGFGGGRSPDKSFGLVAEQVGQRASDGAIVVDESAVKVCKPQETL